MEVGTPAERVELRNQGIPWQASAAATELGLLVPSVIRTLSSLEQRRLIFCWATGEGKGRRVSHVKLTWAAEERACEQETMGMSIFQSTRRQAREWREQQEQRYQEPEDLGLNEDGWGDDDD
ncbi:hypothetical protein [Deinococcus sp. PEB2-63]